MQNTEKHSAPKNGALYLLLFPSPIFLVLLIVLWKSEVSFAQSVGINSTGNTPNASALLDLDASPANDKGLLIPRTSLSDVSLQAPIGGTPPVSLIVYNTNTAITNGNGEGYYYWSGTKWIKIIAPNNGPGTSGQILTSQGAGAEVQWTNLSGTGNGSNITQFTQWLGSMPWVTCYTTCKNATDGGFTDWRMPTMDELYWANKSGLVTPPFMGWGGMGLNTWTTLADPNPANFSKYALFNESGNSSSVDFSVNNHDCRCVR